MKVTKIASVHHLVFKEKIDFQFGDFHLTNDISKIPELLPQGDLHNILGWNEIQSIRDKKTFIYSHTHYKLNDFEELASFLVLGELLCQAFWFIKDNSVTIEFGHLHYLSWMGTPDVHTNFWSSNYFNSKGKRDNVIFNAQDISVAHNLFRLIVNTQYIGEDSFEHASRLTNSISRLTRSLYFLPAARMSRDLATKISHYCTVFECLFSFSNSELKHRLSETVAFFLQENPSKRVEIYKIMQTAYDIRSAIVHGDVLSRKHSSNDFELLRNTASAVDEILRACFIKIFNTEELFKMYTMKTKDEGDSFSRYFQNLIFGIL